MDFPGYSYESTREYRSFICHCHDMEWCEFRFLLPISSFVRAKNFLQKKNVSFSSSKHNDCYLKWKFFLQPASSSHNFGYDAFVLGIRRRSHTLTSAFIVALQEWSFWYFILFVRGFSLVNHYFTCHSSLLQKPIVICLLFWPSIVRFFHFPSFHSDHSILFRCNMIVAPIFRVEAFAWKGITRMYSSNKVNCKQCKCKRMPELSFRLFINRFYGMCAMCEWPFAD